MIVPMVGVAASVTKGPWETVERVGTALFFIVVVGGAIALLFNLVRAMAARASEITGLELLASSISLWVANVLAFSLLYWQLDRGGPGARENLEQVMPDWQFPRPDGPDDLPMRWQPGFTDYLYLAYSTATALSATDVSPFTSRAKLLMMLESTISMVTIVVVASRAINLLGG